MSTFSLVFCDEDFPREFVPVDFSGDKVSDDFSEIFEEDVGVDEDEDEGLDLDSLGDCAECEEIPKQ